MAVLRKFVQPFRRVWSISLGRRLRDQYPHSDCQQSKLYKQVKSCGYQDVHVMWSLLLQQHQLHSHKCAASH